MAIGLRTRESKIWVAIGIMLGALRLVDYFVYGKQLHDVIAALGFFIVALGAYLNGFQTLDAISASGNKSSVNGYAFALVGFGLIVVSMFVKYGQ